MRTDYPNTKRIRFTALVLMFALIAACTMPPAALRAYAGTETYSITVNGGRAAVGPGEEPLTTVDIQEGKPFIFFVFADPSDRTREFDHWEAEGATLTEYQTYSSCFTMSMPHNDLTLTAVFRDTDARKRLAGPNRYATSQAVAGDLMKGRYTGYFDKVIVASGDTYPDALAGSYLAVRLGAPLLMVNAATVQNVADYIRSHTYPDATVYILGGTGAVPQSFETLITSKDYAFRAVRLSGANRYTTNIEILKASGACDGTDPTDVMVCSGKDFADALSASCLASPILLVADVLLPEQAAFLQKPGVGNIYIMGGKGAVSEQVEQAIANASRKTPIRLAGANRYATSAAIAAYFSDTLDAFAGGTVFFASGLDFPDGLSGGPLACSYGAPLLLIDKGRTEDAASYDSAHNIGMSVTLGGTGVLPDDVIGAAMGQ